MSTHIGQFSMFNICSKWDNYLQENESWDSDGIWYLDLHFGSWMGLH